MTDGDLTLMFQSDHDDPDVAALRLVRVYGSERLSATYTYQLWLESDVDQGLSVEAIEGMLNEPARFTAADATVNGVFEQISLEPCDDPTRTVYRAVLVPRLARLAHTVRSRVFQAMTPIAAVESVLTDHRIPFESSYLVDYPEREYIVQYEESDLAFVQRTLEHWGVFFSFEQAPDTETMMLGDDNRAFSFHSEHATLAYAPGVEVGGAAYIGPMERTIRPQTATLTARDYNWRTPFLAEDETQTERMLQLVSPNAVDERTGVGAHRRYGDHFKDDPEGARVALLLAQALMVDRVTHRGALRGPGLRPGHLFSTSGMPIAELEGEYLITSLETELESSTGSARRSQSYEAVPADVPYRPARQTARPIISGFMHAVVDGEVDNAAAPIDKYGRYKCIMPYDENAVSGGAASRWIRMAQPSAGSDYGMHLPLHIGTEVAVYHLGGDPDRPVIASAIPNVDTMSPVVDANATQSRIKTRSNILFELEDDA